MNTQEIYEYLKGKGIYAEVWEQAGQICVEIEWGDWKHEHAYCDYLMKEKNYIPTGEEVTETDGSDCYSAIHYYVEGLVQVLKRNTKKQQTLTIN